ncbi:hypothetical protein JXQ70_11680 [bacterium]|nr:hypothetical protein [bacterium]
MLDKLRRGHSNDPRDLAIYLCCRLRGDTLTDIGLHFGMLNTSR